MKNKRFFAAVVCVVAMSLMFGGCSVSADLAGNMIAPWEQAAKTPQPQVSQEPEKTPAAPSPSQEASEEPSASAEPSAVPETDINGVMFFSPDEVKSTESYWPLTTYTPEHFGTFSSVFVSYGGDYLYLSYTIDTASTVDDLKSELMPYVSGSWEESESEASVYAGKAEEIETDCVISSVAGINTVSFTFSLYGNYNELNDLLDKHWPTAAIALPSEMESSLDTRCVALSPGMIYLSYDYKFQGYKETFQSFRDSMSGMDGYKYTPASGTEGEKIEFKIGDVDVNIGVSEEYEILTVTYISYPPDFTL
jgi:hypothetical protein